MYQFQDVSQKLGLNNRVWLYYNHYQERRHAFARSLFKEDFAMAYVITDECVSCGTCADACPNEAISEGEDKYVINADECVDCGTCADECPNDAIVEG